MQPANTKRFAFIGFGEVGQTFAEGLLRRDDVRISAYDILVGEPAGERLQQRARELGVRLHDSAKAALADAEIVFSAVTASSAEGVARTIGACLGRDQIIFDVNSAAPSTKQRAAGHVASSGAHYVEGAVMAAVLQPGIAVPILAGGPRAADLADQLNALGMNVTAVSDRYGVASAMKLCRSIMIKGMEALMLDCAAASEAWGIKDTVFASLSATFPSIDWHALCGNMRERVGTHGVRRSAEMHEAAEMLSSLGIDPHLATAIAEAQLRGTRSALQKRETANQGA
jgi:3-hydroxyisobutyrate dehydrogenase-like beta-hydroxyacid dehydrogenase